ncbi:hypothetical protein [uncultured Clostridium sp.]|uniref:hypothetical protein n=1 Tax=uncultured Clostridium sp. TaxID=59620 RepID=UPI0025CE141D|nr:hypothetical protein [uncultured Clostridium sp.]
MRINKKYSIESDVLNVTVYEHSVVKEKESKNFGKEVKKAVGYLTTIDQAFKFLIDREVKGTGMEDFNTIMNKIAELRFDIERMLENE